MVTATKATTRRNVRGGSKDPNRGTWCTSESVARAVGPFDLDPFSNPRSHIVSATACMLERGDDGLAGPRRGEYFVAPTGGVLAPGEAQRWPTATGNRVADADTRVWLQPDYRFVRKAFDHYAHTRWAALLRFDPRTDWMKHIYARSELVCVLWESEFEPPPGVEKPPGNTFPHAIYYRYAKDVTDDVLRMSISWRKKKSHG